MYHADIPTLRQAFQSILGFHYHLKMRGYEVDDRPYTRKSFSHMYSLPQPAKTSEELGDTMSKMVHSLGYRLRRAGYRARGLYVGVVYADWTGWHHHRLGQTLLYDTADLYREMMAMLDLQPSFQPVHKVYTGCFGLERSNQIQTTVLHDELKKRSLVAAMDQVHAAHGKHALFPGKMLKVHQKGWVKEFIAFGAVKELEEFEFLEQVSAEADPDYDSAVFD